MNGPARNVCASVVIRSADGSNDMQVVRELFLEYQQGIHVDLCFQGFAEELANLPGCYERPSGGLLLAWQGVEAIGCVGFRPIHAQWCEMKRLYVRSSARGLGLGRKLAKEVIREAHQAGYRSMQLDTLPTMRAAIRLYDSLGFQRVRTGTSTATSLRRVVFSTLPRRF